ncbi:MAG: hypothetical protein EZS28_007902 [Streblomastix strix]|uniref:Uncharacterized protein n=1 Tax=Streblomastix strix TaxID=222440 RepID=A0A5J4WR71_9EUKA|nr:MAG: hypothetical protein EZS28_007902 [Streblomastix strix]
MSLFEPITATITVAIEAFESLHINWYAIWKAIYEAGIKFACEQKLQIKSETESESETETQSEKETQSEYVTLKTNNDFEI